MHLVSVLFNFCAPDPTISAPAVVNCDCASVMNPAATSADLTGIERPRRTTNTHTHTHLHSLSHTLFSTRKKTTKKNAKTGCRPTKKDVGRDPVSATTTNADADTIDTGCVLCFFDCHASSATFI